MGQLQGHVLLPAAEQDVVQAFAHRIQPLVAYHLAAFRLNHRIGHKLVIRPQAILVHELRHRIELFQLVFQRCARKHHCIFGLDMPGSLGNLRVPVLETLHLVHDEEVGAQAAHHLDVVAGCVIGHNLIECLRPVELFPLHGIAFHHHGLCVGEPFYLFFPLVFQRSGA